jgi:acetyl-CoA carboxylase biotin carboxyl carrier protein
MAEPDFDLESIEKLIRLVEARSLTELIVEEGGLKVTVRGASFVRRKSAASAGAPVPEAAAALEAVEALQWADSVAIALDEEAADTRIALASPMVGVFYRSSGPDTPAYVEVGDRVEIGQIVGLIEAMKVFSEVPAEAAGTVVAIAASNGQLVRAGDPLVFLQPD